MVKLAESPPVPSSATNRKTRGSLLAGLAAAMAWMILIGCGDVYRPVANPVIKPGGDPQATHAAVVLSNNNGAPGMVTSIDVSGDTNIGNFVVGRAPVFGSFVLGTGQLMVANKNDDTVSAFTPLLQTAIVTFITLPTGARPVYLASTEPRFMYSANSGNDTVGVIDVATNTIQLSIPVGRTPVALAEKPDGTVLYSVNQGDNTVSVISTADKSVSTTIPVGASPVAAVMNSDGKTVYVLNQGSGTVSAIDTTSSAVLATLATGASPRSAIFDSRRRRLYVANTGSNTISVFDADVGLAFIKNVTVGAAPASLVALADGSRVYVANAGCTDAVNLSGCSGTTVSVVDAVGLAVTRTITVGSTPVALGTDPGSTKVVVANRDSNNISSIRTSDDTVVNTNASGAPQPTFVVVSP